jgi:hypothetical protein
MAWRWMIEYSEERDHDSLGGLTPAEVRENYEPLTAELSS